VNIVQSIEQVCLLPDREIGQRSYERVISWKKSRNVEASIVRLNSAQALNR
jgi:hypothetical protein